MNATFKLMMALVAAVVLSACASKNTGTVVGGQGTGAVDDVSDAGASTVIVDDSRVSDSGSTGFGAGSNLETVFYFDFDTSSLSFEARSSLDAWAASLTSNPRDIRLEGHADERGTREYNIALGLRRAKAISDYLISSGVSARLIEVISYGEERPAVPGSGDSAWSRNRRVELK